MALKDFRPEIDDQNEGVAKAKSVKETASAEKAASDAIGKIDKPESNKDINVAEIKKLSRRINIMTVLIPCILAAVIVFAYMNIKNDAVSSQSQRDKTIQDFQEQTQALNRAFNVQLEKIQFDMEGRLTELNSKNAALEKQLKQLKASQLDRADINKRLKTIDARIAKNAAQTKKSLQDIESTKNDTAKLIELMQKNIAELRQTLDTRLAAMDTGINEINTDIESYEQKVLILSKNLSINDKRLKSMEQGIVSKAEIEDTIKQITKNTSAEIDTLDKRTQTQLKNIIKKMDNQLYRLQKEINLLKKVYKE